MTCGSAQTGGDMDELSNEGSRNAPGYGSHHHIGQEDTRAVPEV